MKLLLLIALVLPSAGCSEAEHVSVADFKKEFAAVGQIQSVRHVEYLGQRDGKAYIKISSMRVIGSKWKERVIFVELSDLDDAFRASLPKNSNLQRNAMTRPFSVYEHHSSCG